MQSAGQVKLVVDTNVLISILIGKSLGKLKAKLRSGEVQLVFSPILLDEFRSVVTRPHFRSYFEPEAVVRFLGLIERTGIKTLDVPAKVAISRDPKDDYLIMLAKTSRADLLVTGDKDLLVLDGFEGVRIIAPAKLLEELAQRM